MKIRITSQNLVLTLIILFVLHTAYSYVITDHKYDDLTIYEHIGLVSCISLSIIAIFLSIAALVSILSGDIKLFPDKEIDINFKSNKKQIDELHRKIGEASVKNGNVNIEELFKELDKLKK